MLSESVTSTYLIDEWVEKFEPWLREGESSEVQGDKDSESERSEWVSLQKFKEAIPSEDISDDGISLPESSTVSKNHKSLKGKEPIRLPIPYSLRSRPSATSQSSTSQCASINNSELIGTGSRIGPGQGSQNRGEHNYPRLWKQNTLLKF